MEKNNHFDSKIQEMPSIMADYSNSFSSVVFVKIMPFMHAWNNVE